MMSEQALPLTLLVRFGREQLRMCGRVVDELREQHCAACSKRAACPPKVQRAWVAVADALLAGGFAVDDVERKGDFDELGWHQASS